MELTSSPLVLQANRYGQRSSARHQTGGEYYLSHLNQLQQSALTFDFALSEIVKSVSRSEKTALQKTDLTTTAIDHANAAPISHTIARAPICPLSDSANQSRIQPLASQLQSGRQCQNYLPQQNPEPVTDSTAEPLPIDRATRLSRQPVCKNYHLYCHAGQVEIALNTINLTHQETQSLKSLLKQWLANTKLKLKQVVVNGVKQ